MADEVKKAQDVQMDSSVDEAQKELAKEGKTYPDNFTRVIDEFDDDVRQSYGELKDKVSDLGKKIEESKFGDTVKKDYDDLKGKLKDFFSKFDKEHVEKDVDDLKTHIDNAKEKVDDSEVGQDIKSGMDDIKDKLDTIKSSVSSSSNS